MFSDSTRQTLYLRSSDHTPDPEPEVDEFWLALQDRMASHINEVTAADGNGHDVDDERVFADLMGYGSGRGGDGTSSPILPQTPPAEKLPGGRPWLPDFAGLDDAFAMQNDGDAAAALPGLVRVPSSDSETESETESESESDEDSVSSSLSTSRSAEPTRRGVSFSSTVEVRTIPHRSAYTFCQRRRMYSSTLETKQNRRRNRKEFRYDGCDWRNATEERDMRVDELTSELVHPAHEHELSYSC